MKKYDLLISSAILLVIILVSIIYIWGRFVYYR